MAAKKPSLADFVAKNTPRRLFLDIETSPNVVYSWRVGRKITIDYENIVQERAIICIGYKWQGKPVRCLTWDNGDDKSMLEEFVPVLESADEIVAHFGDRFDVPWLRARAAHHGILISPYLKTIDTKAQSSRSFYFNSNRLDYLSQFLKLGKKIETDFKLWKDVVAGNERALARMVQYCFTPDHKLLGQDLRWKSADQFKVGDVVLGFDENPSKRQRKFRQAIIQNIAFDDQTVFEVGLESGKVFRVTADHLWLVRNGNAFHWLKTSQLRSNTKDRNSVIPRALDVWENDNSYEAGWLAGMFDGEGSLSGRTHCLGRLQVAQNPGPVLDKIEHVLTQKHPELYQKRITNEGRTCVSVHLRGAKADTLRFLGSIRPERLLRKVNFDQLGNLEFRKDDDRVVSVESAGIQRIIQIETSTGTLIVDGYAHHNCKHDVRLLERVYLTLEAYNKPKMHYGVAWGGVRSDCPRCGSDDTMRIGQKVSGYGTVQPRLRCRACGGEFLTTLAELNRRNSNGK